VVIVSVVGTVLFFVVVVVVDVVVGVGFSTTVVQEFRAKATAKSGVRMISFFIVGVVPSQIDSAQMPQPDVFRAQFFEICQVSRLFANVIVWSANVAASLRECVPSSRAAAAKNDAAPFLCALFRQRFADFFVGRSMTPIAREPVSDFAPVTWNPGPSH
jgi:hypothetical protein